MTMFTLKNNKYIRKWKIITMENKRANEKGIGVIGLLSICFFLSSDGLAQGSWNMTYLPIDSVSDSLIDKEIRVDFRTSLKGKEKWTENIRKIFSTRDTVILAVEGQSVRFVENWKIHVDHGVLSDQTLQSINGNDNPPLVIKEMFIRAMNKSTLTLEIHIYHPGDKVKLRAQQITIEKALINGVLLEL